MKKIIIASLVAFSLAACATVNNPVGVQSLATVEAAYGAALAAAVSYKRLCIAGHTEIVGENCRAIVVKMQAADRYAHAQVLVARRFVKSNPTLDASVIVATARDAVTAFQAAEQANGVQ